MKTKAISQPAKPVIPAAAPKSVRRTPKKEKTSQKAEAPAAVQEDQNVSVNAASSPQEDHIASRAYSIWQEQGRPEGSHEDHWHQAVRELSGQGPA